MPRPRETTATVTDYGTYDRRGRRRRPDRGRRSYDRAEHPRPDVPSVSVVIPTLNEARNLMQLLPRIPTWVREIIIVDGASVDGTVQVAREHGDNVRIVLTPARGKGAALRVGFQEAVGDVIVALDADGSTDPAEISAFVGLLASGADVVMGSRFAMGGGTTDMEWYRRVGNWFLTKLVRFAFGIHYSDLCYGYFGFWRDMLPSLDGPFSGFEVETIIHIRAVRSGLRIAEVPSFEAPRIWGASNLQTMPDGMRVLRAIFGEWRRNRRSERRDPSGRTGLHVVPDPSRAGRGGAGGPDRRGAR